MLLLIKLALLRLKSTEQLPLFIKVRSVAVELESRQRKLSKNA